MSNPPEIKLREGWLGRDIDRAQKRMVELTEHQNGAALDRGLATGRLIDEAERLIRTIETSRKKAVRELPIAPLLAAVERAKETNQ